ncbi:MAG: hypothetical protein AVDCRST_MAG40-374, partial [uncultured Gemmatimonadaceae bacterium]
CSTRTFCTPAGGVGRPGPVGGGWAANRRARSAWSSPGAGCEPPGAASPPGRCRRQRLRGGRRPSPPARTAPARPGVCRTAPRRRH